MKKVWHMYAALKHLSTAENQNKMKIYKTLGQETNEMRKNTLRAKIPSTTLVSSFRFIWIPMLWVYGH